jgi:hypothetical protein
MAKLKALPDANQLRRYDEVCTVAYRSSWTQRLR